MREFFCVVVLLLGCVFSKMTKSFGGQLKTKSSSKKTAQKIVFKKTGLKKNRSANGRATINDVAKQAGVGAMTVSRVLNRPEMVSPELRKNILRVIEQLGYIPNRVAGGLASGTAYVVPVILPTLKHSVYVPFLEGLYSLLPEQGYQILLAASEYKPEAEEKLIETLLGWRPDGIVVSGVDHTPRSRSMLQRAGIPVVEIMDLTEKPIDMNVGFSHREVGCGVANFLIAKGYKRMAHVGSFAQHDVRAARRIEGFRETLKKAKLPAHIVESSDKATSIDLGRELIASLLKREPKVDAVFFANDDLAAGALFECARRGIRVPEQLAIVGFNDQEIAGQVSPAITSVVTPRFEMGRHAAEMLLKRMRGQVVKPKKLDLGFGIVERAST